ncbi:MAG: hypothetical protein H6822_21725 [Planctomycetaceae bacterium]|nr:hypothetical protein [Planctomycetales bacterium]MCB9924816.1 hypothetical protein [Planctomycetaceae bacterium]
MTKFLTLLSMVAIGLAVGCGPKAAEPATQAEQEAMQTSMDNYMKNMPTSSDSKTPPDMSGAGKSGN